MRRLLLLRHAKADRAEPGASDHARVLTERGRADAQMIGAYLARHGFRPDRVLVSTAARTEETWTSAARALKPPPPATLEKRIYEATAQTLFQLIQGAGDAASLLLVGHNPGLHELAVTLVASGDIDARERLREKLPTSGLVVIEFAFDDWKDLHPRSGRLVRFVNPKWIAAAIK